MPTSYTVVVSFFQQRTGPTSVTPRWLLEEVIVYSIRTTIFLLNIVLHLMAFLLEHIFNNYQLFMAYQLTYQLLCTYGLEEKTGLTERSRSVITSLGL